MASKKGRVAGFEINFGLPEKDLLVVKETRDKREKELKNIASNIAAFQTFGFLFSLPPITSGIYVSGILKDEQAKHMDEVDHLIGTNEVLSPAMSLCYFELKTFLSELQYAAYNGAARTLRWILEYTLRACEFQTDPARPNANYLISNYLSLVRVGADRKHFAAFLSKHNARAAFIELYRYLEQNRQTPSVNRLTGKLNQRKIFKLDTYISTFLKETYGYLCSRVHPGIQEMAPFILDEKYAAVQFDQDEFQKTYELTIQIIDSLLYLFTTCLSQYYVEEPSELLQLIANSCEVPKKFVENVNNLNWTSKITKTVNWKKCPKKSCIRFPWLHRANGSGSTSN